MRAGSTLAGALVRVWSLGTGRSAGRRENEIEISAGNGGWTPAAWPLAWRRRAEASAFESPPDDPMGNLLPNLGRLSSQARTMSVLLSCPGASAGRQSQSSL